MRADGVSNCCSSSSPNGHDKQGVAVGIHGSVVATEEVVTPLRGVQIEGRVFVWVDLELWSCIRGCAEDNQALQLLILDVGRVLEVTDCFPSPLRGKEV
ncbi:hypothetical protein QQ045_015684 [Rhodiola kirilowii]